MADEPKKRGPRGDGSVRERSPGRWELRYALAKDAAGKRRSVTVTVPARNKKEARAALRARLAEVDKGAHVDPSRMTVGEFVEKWLADWVASNVSPKTGERYGEILRHHVVPHLGATLLQKLSVLDLTGLYAKLLKEGRGEGLGLSGRTVLHVHRAIHRMLRHAVQWRMVQSNVASSTDAPKAQAAKIEILDPAAVKAVLAALRQRNAPTAASLYALVSTALGTGMRRGELLALRWQDVDLDRAVLRVERSLEQTKAGGLRFKAPKTNYGRRSIALPGFVVSDLRAHWKVQQEARLALGLGKAASADLVFPGPTFEPRSPNALTKEWAAASTAVGAGVTFHALRHTHASNLIAAGLDVLTISRRLGHGSPSITLNIYGHKMKDSDDRAVRALDAAFSSGTEREPSANG